MEEGAGTPWTQCPMQFRPLFKGIAKNYPTSGMLETRYADETFDRLLSGQDRIISVGRREALAAGFPSLFEVVSSCGWKRIPREFVPLLKALREKARIPLRCAEVIDLKPLPWHMPSAKLSSIGMTATDCFLMVVQGSCNLSMQMPLHSCSFQAARSLSRKLKLPMSTCPPSQS